MFSNKKLMLFSSGQSVAGDEFENINKPLTKEGSEAVRLTAHTFNLKGIFPDKIISSIEENAYQTACILAEKISFPQKLIFKNSVLYESLDHEQIFRYLKNFEKTCQCLMFVAQSEVISGLASFLCPSFERTMQRGSVLGLEFRVKEWDALTGDSGTFLFYLRPC